MTGQTKDEPPLVSVVIPTYNRSKELARAIKSVLNQTYQNFEILVVDDGSEEDLRVVCDSFNDQRIRLLRNETHTNANVARNRGIQEAKGEYIAMLDSDDEYLPHHLRRRIEKIKEWKCDGIFGSAYENNGTELAFKFSRPIRQGETMINYLFDGGSATTPSHFYTKINANDIKWDENLKRHQDLDFSARFADKYTFKTDVEPTIIVNWRKGERRQHDFSSYIYFIEKWQSKIKPHLFIGYLVNMYKLAIIENQNHYATTIYKHITKNIYHLSLTQWINLNSPTSKFKALLTFIIQLIKKIIRELYLGKYKK